MVRAELGDEAVILSTRRVSGGVEVTAALQPAEEEPILIQPAPPLRRAEEAAPAVVAATMAPPPPPVPPALVRHNLPPALAARFADAALAPQLAAELSFAALPDGIERPLLLAGPPGAGKTLSCAKLAARAVLSGTQPLVITTDDARAGATEQLAAFTRVLGLTLAIAASPGTLAKAIARRAPGQAVLIDTAGCDPFDPEQAAALHALAQASGADIALVLPAGLDAAESCDLARAFAALGARHLVPTRLDIARRLGGVLAAAATGLALAEAGTGAGVADGLTLLSPDWLARRLEAGSAAWPQDVTR